MILVRKLLEIIVKYLKPKMMDMYGILLVTESFLKILVVRRGRCIGKYKNEEGVRHYDEKYNIG